MVGMVGMGMEVGEIMVMGMIMHRLQVLLVPMVPMHLPGQRGSMPTTTRNTTMARRGRRGPMPTSKDSIPTPAPILLPTQEVPIPTPKPTPTTNLSPKTMMTFTTPTPSSNPSRTATSTNTTGAVPPAPPPASIDGRPIAPPSLLTASTPPGPAYSAQPDRNPTSPSFSRAWRSVRGDCSLLRSTPRSRCPWTRCTSPSMGRCSRRSTRCRGIRGSGRRFRYCSCRASTC
mmetsp:Transcript_4727/g.10430  ORF Transcript_4727/g.10430 Transcript_4727/m.10430 type:complete len:230 (+) Transcript_4727:320-1009(+)